MSIWLRRIYFCLGNLVCAALISIGPAIFVRRGFSGFFNQWQEVAFYAIALSGSAISGLLGFGLSSGIKETSRQRKVVWATIAFGFLYISSAVLCQKLRIALIDNDFWRNSGLILVLTGGTLRIWAIAMLGQLHSAFVTIQPEHRLIEGGPYRWLRHPSYLGGILIAIGAPMIFGTWFPLLAIPGIFVVIKWRMDDEEALLSEHFGEAYESFKKKTKRLVPFVY